MTFQRFILAVAVLTSVTAAAATKAPPPAASVTVKIVGFNDFHGSLLSPGTYSVAPGQPSVVVGGVDTLAAYVAQRISLNPNHAVVSAGDVTGASPLISAAYHDEGTIEALNLLGLEFNAVGNHEFDSAPAELKRKQAGGCLPATPTSCLGGKPFKGAAFKYLAANTVESATGKTMFPPYAIKTFDGLKVAFIGVTLKDTADIVLPTGVAGLTFKDEAEAINALIPALRRQGARAIVALVHQGGKQTAEKNSGTPMSINDCAGQLGGASASQIVDVVSRLDDAVDMVFSAHSHVAYNCQLPNSKGRAIPVTQAAAFGRVLTDADLTLDRKTGRVTHVAATNILVSVPEAEDAASPVHPFLAAPNVVQIRTRVADYNAAVAALASQVIGTIAVRLPNGEGPSGETPAGNLVADAQLAVTAAADRGGAVVSFVNATGVRSPGFDTPGATYPHDVTYQEAFTARPFGNTLMTVTVTAQVIKDALEQQFAACSGQDHDTMLQVSAGMRIEWSASGPKCAKIRNVSLTLPGTPGVTEQIVVDGTVKEPAKTYRIAVDNFLSSGKGGFAAFLKGTDLRSGPQDIDAVVSYMSTTHKAPLKPYDPADPSLRLPRIVKLP